MSGTERPGRDRCPQPEPETGGEGGRQPEKKLGGQAPIFDGVAADPETAKHDGP